MEKRITILFIIFCSLFVAILPAYKVTVKADQRKWIIPDDFDTIQKAINNASVLPGDIIFVRKGIYYENIVVNKSLSIVGEDRASTIIDGNGGGSVISIKGVNNVKIEEFTLRNSGVGANYFGVYVEYSSNNIIRFNTIVNNYGGLRLDHSDSNVILGNTISSNKYHGINIYISNNNIISFNTISFNNYHGIYLTSSNNNRISNNVISSNKQDTIGYDGLLLLESRNNVISNNNISDNDNGISFISSMNNIISGNAFHLNKNNALYLTFSSNNNLIYRNNFFDQVQTTDTTNIWDDGYEGNYWPNYAGQDLDKDGIGDTPYTIVANNLDNHPLMGRFSSFSIAVNGAIYTVHLISNSTFSDLRFEIGAETGSRIIRYDITGKNGTVGFSRVMIPTGFLQPPLIIVTENAEITPSWLSISNSTHLYAYFTYFEGNYTISIISSQTLRVYNELLEMYNLLLQNFQDLNMTYQNLLKYYSDVSRDYSQLRKDVNETRADLDNLLNLLNNLLGNYTRLQEDYEELQNSYQKHLSNYSENEQNLRSLMHIFAATTAIFLVTTIYLTKKSLGAGKIEMSE
ncbi:MAG: NosD domain-containing protein [Candidatus Jordarchaeaceae archaeon]